MTRKLSVEEDVLPGIKDALVYIQVHRKPGSQSYVIVPFPKGILTELGGMEAILAEIVTYPWVFTAQEYTKRVRGFRSIKILCKAWKALALDDQPYNPEEI